MTHTRAAVAAACVLGMTGWLTGMARAAGAPAWPAEWTAFGPVPPAAGMERAGRPTRDHLVPGSALVSIPAALEIGGQTYKGQPVSPDTEGRVDLGAFFGGVERGTTVYLMAVVKSAQAQTVKLGAGADWWMQWWLDGVPLYDTLAGGNVKGPIATDNHVFEVPLKAGDNVLAVAAVSGSRGFALAAGDPAAGTPTARYTQTMAAGREKQKRVAKLQATSELASAARADFERAAALAANDAERAAALLELGNACVEDPDPACRPAARAAYGRVLELPFTVGQWPQARSRAEALIGLARCRLAERDYAAARAALDKAAEPLAHGQLRQRLAVQPTIEMLMARISLRTGDVSGARRRLDAWHAKLAAIADADDADGIRLQARRAMTETDRLRASADMLEEWRRLRETPAAAERAPAPGPEPPTPTELLRRLERGRPRLFLNQRTLGQLRERKRTPFQAEWLKELRRLVEAGPRPPTVDDAFKHKLLREGGRSYGPTSSPRVGGGPWGTYAVQAAFVWLLTGERSYCERAVECLEHAAACWDLIYRDRRLPAARVYERIHTLTAYDWLYDELSAAQRTELAARLFPALRSVYEFWRAGRPGFRDIYTDTVMGWYLGLALLDTDAPEAPADELLDILREGYLRHINIFTDLQHTVDGLELYGSLGYANQNPVSEIVFLESFRAATGAEFGHWFPKRSIGLASYFLWNSITPVARRLSARPLKYGWGDPDHSSNTTMRSPYLLRLPDLWSAPENETAAETLTAIIQAQVSLDPQRYAQTFLRDLGVLMSPVTPLLVGPRVLADDEIMNALARLPRARHFPDPIGQTFMNSGWGENDTYALFMAGRQTFERKHYDENHFTIYKKGFLAMDTGSQIEGNADGPGGGRPHQINYFMDTIAHNCVLIRMEGEQFPGYWGVKATANNGGMNRNYGASVRAFETDGLYTYVASDATSCYHSNKAAEVVRQFLFVYPDWFVVCDRLEAKAADQKKSWLFHTQYEPAVTGDTFRAEHWEGAVCVRTLLPRDRVSVKIGGPGKEFWADGRNWPAADAKQQRYMADPAGTPTPDRNLFGQWRMEISPAQARTRDLFLHLIEVGDKTVLTAMTPSTLIEDEQTAGVEFQAGARTVRVVFQKAGAVGGHIRIAEGGAVLADRPLATAVQRQEGLALAQ